MADPQLIERAEAWLRLGRDHRLDPSASRVAGAATIITDLLSALREPVKVTYWMVEAAQEELHNWREGRGSGVLTSFEVVQAVLNAALAEATPTPERDVAYAGPSGPGGGNRIEPLTSRSGTQSPGVDRPGGTGATSMADTGARGDGSLLGSNPQPKPAAIPANPTTQPQPLTPAGAPAPNDMLAVAAELRKGATTPNYSGSVVHKYQDLCNLGANALEAAAKREKGLRSQHWPRRVEKAEASLASIKAERNRAMEALREIDAHAHDLGSSDFRSALTAARSLLSTHPQPTDTSPAAPPSPASPSDGLVEKLRERAECSAIMGRGEDTDAFRAGANRIETLEVEDRRNADVIADLYNKLHDVDEDTADLRAKLEEAIAIIHDWKDGTADRHGRRDAFLALLSSKEG